jgi:hypothetical protein
MLICRILLRASVSIRTLCLINIVRSFFVKMSPFGDWRRALLHCFCDYAQPDTIWTHADHSFGWRASSRAE